MWLIWIGVESWFRIFILFCRLGLHSLVLEASGWLYEAMLGQLWMRLELVISSAAPALVFPATFLSLISVFFVNEYYFYFSMFQLEWVFSISGRRLTSALNIAGLQTSQFRFVGWSDFLSKTLLLEWEPTARFCSHFSYLSTLGEEFWWSSTTTYILTDCLHALFISFSIVQMFLAAISLRDHSRHRHLTCWLVLVVEDLIHYCLCLPWNSYTS